MPRLTHSLHRECSACGQAIDFLVWVSRDALPVNSAGDFDGDAILALGICPICRGNLPDNVDMMRVRRVLRRLGWELAPLQCPPGSASLPFDWI